MKKKVSLVLIMCLICLCCTGCQNDADRIEIHNKRPHIFDDIYIEIKSGYFYKEHEKFTVDENIIGVTIYFSQEDDAWD